MPTQICAARPRWYGGMATGTGQDIMGSLLKHSAETYEIGVDYSAVAPVGATVIASGTWSATDEAGADATATVLASATATILRRLVATGRVQGGVINTRYILTLTVTFDTDDVLQDVVHMRILDS